MRLEYPHDIAENLKFRAKLFTECARDKDFALKVREYTYRDLLFFFNAFCWAYDPMVDSRHGINVHLARRPIVTYPYQDEAISEINDCIENGNNLFIDKSRDMLATYMVLYTYQWRWICKEQEQFRVGSRKQEYVDVPGDMATLFEKLRYNISFMPSWIQPRGFSIKNKQCSSFMKLINPEKKCAIIGEATNASFARGDRKTSVFYDEFQEWEMAEEAWRAASDSTRCKIAAGTPKGSGNKFAELSRTDEVKQKLHLIWYLHPEKAYTGPEHLEKAKRGLIFDRVTERTVEVSRDQSPAPSGCYVSTDGRIHSEWYDLECERRKKEDIQENLDCNYLTTGNPIFNTLKCAENQRKSRPPIETGNLSWKIPPVFDTSGRITNFDKLMVDFVPNPNGLWKIWEHPVDGWVDGYAISADVAEGLEQGDFDSAPVLKRFSGDGQKPTVVADLHARIKTFEFADELAKCGVYYGRCTIAVERNNTMGGAVLEQIFRYYPHLYHKDIFTKGYPTRTDKLGWETHQGTKGQIIGYLSKAIEFDLFEDNDTGFWSETLTFVNDDGRLEAQGKARNERCYDDRIMSRAILLWISGQLPPATRKRVLLPHTDWRKKFNKPQGDLVRF